MSYTALANFMWVLALILCVIDDTSTWPVVFIGWAIVLQLREGR